MNNPISKSEIKRIAAVNPKQLEEECLKLRHKLQIAEEVLVDLLSWCANGTNYGKGWSEYQIDDDAIAKARAAPILAKIVEKVIERIDEAQRLVGPLTYNSSQALMPLTQAWNVLARARNELDRIVAKEMGEK